MISDIKKLSQMVHLDLMVSEQGNSFANFPLQVTASFVKRIKLKDINDPLLLQILPQKKELLEQAGFTTDPLEEKKYSPIDGLIHKYIDRVLLLVTDICALNCRFCFRRYFHAKVSDWHKVFTYITDHPTISEVILSGGDPLMLKADELLNIIKKLAKIPHLKRLRVHSRVPIAMPEKSMLPLTHTRLPVVLVVHCNHPNEINTQVAKSLNVLRQEGVTILNQSVLLHKINADVVTLIALSEKLFKVGVLPYYLHILDKVKGTSHFYVDSKQGKQIYLEMKTKLPGYLVPKLVVEVQNKKLYV